MANLALALGQAVQRRRALGAPGQIGARALASGEGWLVTDVLCTSGPGDRAFEETYEADTIAVVLAGSFQCRSGSGRELLTPGAVMLGTAGRCYECGHDHADGDRCVSFQFAPGYLPRLSADAGIRRGWTGFRHIRVPATQPTMWPAALCAAGADSANAIDWGTLVHRLAVSIIALDAGEIVSEALPPAAEARVTRVVRRIDAEGDHDLPLDALAREAGLSPYHFLRTFERVTGSTPHQYLRRARLRTAAARLVTTPDRVVDVALECGFGDVSNFNRAFRAQFGTTPIAYRREGRA